MEVCWPEAEPAAAVRNLRVALHTARHALEPELPPRSRKAPTSSSRSAQIRDTSDLEIPESAPNALTKSSTLRVDTPRR